MAQFTYVGSLDGNQQPSLWRMVIKASDTLNIGDAVGQSSTSLNCGVSVVTAGVNHALHGIVHGFVYGDGRSFAPATGKVNATSVAAPAANDAKAWNNPAVVYALVDLNPNSIYSCSITSGALAITAGAAGTGGGNFANLGTATTGAQVLSNTLTIALGQFFVLGPNPQNQSLSVGPNGGTSLPELLVTVAQSFRFGSALAAQAAVI